VVAHRRVVLLGDPFRCDASPYGVLDMSGNVWEWTRSVGGKDIEPEFRYPYQPNDGRENLNASDAINRVLRGGGFFFSLWFARCACRRRVCSCLRRPPQGLSCCCAPTL
jgi:formylglycine-generating enzyme required for sulfatase activity